MSDHVTHLKTGHAFVVTLWNGERSRPLRWANAESHDDRGIAYVSASNDRGEGFTIWARDALGVVELDAALRAREEFIGLELTVGRGVR